MLLLESLPASVGDRGADWARYHIALGSGKSCAELLERLDCQMQARSLEIRYRTLLAAGSQLMVPALFHHEKF